MRLHVTDKEDPFDPGTLKELRTSEDSRSLNSLEFHRSSSLLGYPNRVGGAAPPPWRLYLTVAVLWCCRASRPRGHGGVCWQKVPGR